MSKTSLPAGNLRLQHLHLAKLLDSSGTVRAAAGQLNRTQPALTKMLHEMESALQTKLFERGRLGTKPTASGHAFISRARVILNEWMILQDELAAAAQGEAEILRIGATPLTTLGFLPEALQRFRVLRPRVLARIHEASIHDLLISLINGEVDCVIGRFSGELHDMEGFRHLRHERLFDETLAIIAGPKHRLARKRKIDWKDLAEAEWALPPTELATRQTLNASFIRAGQNPPRPIYESSSFMTNIALANQLGVLSVVPVEAAEMAKSYGLVSTLKTEMADISATVSLVRRHPAPEAQALKILFQALRQTARAKPLRMART